MLRVCVIGGLVVAWSALGAAAQDDRTAAPCNSLCQAWLSWRPSGDLPAAPDAGEPSNPDGGLAPTPSMAPKQASGATFQHRYKQTRGAPAERSAFRGTRPLRAAAFQRDGSKHPRIASAVWTKGNSAPVGIIRAAVRSRAAPTEVPAQALSTAPVAAGPAPAATVKPAADVPVAPLE